MRQFRQEGRSGKPREFGRRDGPRRSEGGRDGPRRADNRGFGGRRESRRDSNVEMHKVVCDKCGKECEVPFKPSSSKPIYCDDCFKKEDPRSKGNSSNQLDEINKKLDRILEALKIN